MTSQIDQLKLIATALQVDIHDCPADKSLGEWLASLVNRERRVLVTRNTSVQECTIKDLRVGDVFCLDQTQYIVEHLPEDLTQEPYAVEVSFYGDESNFHQVSKMNVAFGNPQGDPLHIDWQKIRRQVANILDEFTEAQQALGAPAALIAQLKAMSATVKACIAQESYSDAAVVLDKVRDSLCDVNVFSYGGHHLMGIDADRDMRSVINGVMSRFVKDAQDLEASKAKHAAAGVTEVYTEGDFPTMILKSGSDQPDAPRGKFLKSASFSEPVLYPLNEGSTK